MEQLEMTTVMMVTLIMVMDVTHHVVLRLAMSVLVEAHQQLTHVQMIVVMDSYMAQELPTIVMMAIQTTMTGVVAPAKSRLVGAVLEQTQLPQIHVPTYVVMERQ